MKELCLLKGWYRRDIEALCTELGWDIDKKFYFLYDISIDEMQFYIKAKYLFNGIHNEKNMTDACRRIAEIQRAEINPRHVERERKNARLS